MPATTAALLPCLILSGFPNDTVYTPLTEHRDVDIHMEYTVDGVVNGGLGIAVQGPLPYDDYSVIAPYNESIDTKMFPTTAVLNWAGTASQNSQFLSDTILGSGAIDFSITAQANEATAMSFEFNTESTFSTFFELDEAMLFTLDLSLTTSIGALSSFTMSQIGGGFFMSEFGFPGVPFDETFSGTLEPGQYAVGANASASFGNLLLAGEELTFSSDSSFDFTLTLAPVPAPGAISLFALCGLVGSRRRRVASCA